MRSTFNLSHCNTYGVFTLPVFPLIYTHRVYIHQRNACIIMQKDVVNIISRIMTSHIMCPMLCMVRRMCCSIWFSSVSHSTLFITGSGTIPLDINVEV